MNTQHPTLPGPQKDITHQILISQINRRTLCIPISEASSLTHLKEFIHRIEGIHPEDQRLILNGNDLLDSVKYLEAISQKADFLSLKFALRGGCFGGKGGFGSLLRSAKSVKKTTNYGSCRDLHGRRLRDVQNERRLNEWSEKEVGRKGVEKDVVVGRKKEEEEAEEEERKEEEYKKKEEKEKWELETKQITAGVGNSVEKGLALMKEKELKRKREENNDTSNIKLFGLDDEEDELSDSESESKEPEKKKPCPELHSPSYPCTTSLTTTTQIQEHTTITTNTTSTTTYSTTTNTSISTTTYSLGPPVGSKRTAEIAL